MSIARYTFVLDFRGGTYISQVEAGDEIDAVLHWTRLLEAAPPGGRWAHGLARRIRNELEGFPPVPLTGLTDVWSLTSSHGRSLVLVNIIRSM